jgi:cysteine desulfurase
VHTDAVQAVGQVPVDFAASGVDALTLTGHKLGGPYGVGALVVRRELDVTRCCTAGARSATSAPAPSTPRDRRLRRRVELAVQRRPSTPPGRALRDDLVAGCARRCPTPRSTATRIADRLPGNAHLTFPAARATRC